MLGSTILKYVEGLCDITVKVFDHKTNLKSQKKDSDTEFPNTTATTVLHLYARIHSELTFVVECPHGSAESFSSYSIMFGMSLFLNSAQHVFGIFNVNILASVVMQSFTFPVIP